MRLPVTITVGLMFCLMSGSVHAAGVWTKLKNSPPTGGAGTMMLLTDGTVMVQGPGITDKWAKLSPDSAGNYINGTWSSMASMGTKRLYFASNVLPSGKVFVLGGEYSSAGSITNTGEIYDPVANTWTVTAPFPLAQFGDDPSVLLPNGKVLCGYIFDGRTYLYDPVSNSWSQTGKKLRNDRSDEETWVMLPDGSILSYDIFSSPETGAGNAQKYNPSTGTWSDAGSVPVPLTDAANLGEELGPAALLPDGRVIQVGANNNTVLYTPSTNSWAAGPTLPSGMGSDDAPGAMLPNGRFVFASETTKFKGNTKLYEFDYTTNAITEVTPTGASAPNLSGVAYTCRMLILPNGHMLFTSGDGVVWDYAPVGTPQAVWAPTISSVAKTTTNNVYTITGTQLTGISEGSSYGDDVENSTNYPIVRLTDSSGVVQYLRTMNWTPGVATGSKLVTAQFTTPIINPLGKYKLAVIANGIASKEVDFPPASTSTSQNVVRIAYDSTSKTLTLTGDANPNSVSVSYQSGAVKIEGANGTKLTTSTKTTLTSADLLDTYAFAFSSSNQLVMSVDLGDGDDAINVVGVNSSTTNVTLGAGADKAAFTLSNFGTLLNVDGGPGTDVVIVTSSTYRKYTTSNVP